jgi:hypothetical protein
MLRLTLDTKTTLVGRKNQISQESELCYVQMREKHPQYISSNDL